MLKHVAPFFRCLDAAEPEALMALPSQMLLLCAALLLACTPAGAAHRLLQATNQPPLTSSVDPASETIPSTAVISPDILLQPADPVAAAAATAESIRDRSPVTVVTLAADVIAAAAAEAPLDPAEVAAAQAAFKASRLPLDGPAATSAPLTPGFSGFGTPGPLNLDPEQAGLTQDGFYRSVSSFFAGELSQHADELLPPSITAVCVRHNNCEVNRGNRKKA
jgi:hypothetical protein